MTKSERPPTARERALLEAATNGAPEEFVHLCKMLDRDPKDMLDEYDAEPWRWMIVSFSPGYVSESTLRLTFPPDTRALLDATRRCVEMR